MSDNPRDRKCFEPAKILSNDLEFNLFTSKKVSQSLVYLEIKREPGGKVGQKERNLFCCRAQEIIFPQTNA